MNAWIPTWFVGLGYSATDSVALQTWNNVAAIASNIAVGFVSDKVGRKRNLALLVAVLHRGHHPVLHLRGPEQHGALHRAHAAVRLRAELRHHGRSAAHARELSDGYPQHRHVVVPGVRPLRRLCLLHRARRHRRHGVVPDGCGHHQLVAWSCSCSSSRSRWASSARVLFVNGNGRARSMDQLAAEEEKLGDSESDGNVRFIAHARDRGRPCGAVHRLPARRFADWSKQPYGTAAHGYRPAAARSCTSSSSAACSWPRTRASGVVPEGRGHRTETLF